MRVLLNGLPTLKSKTGVGYYAAELHAALARQFPTDEFTLYPGDMARSAWHRLPARPTSTFTTPAPATVTHGGSRVRGALKSLARDLVGVHFASYSRRYEFDVYHETNFVPFPAGLPTVLNVHDLSVILHPEWHPADRVRHHQQRFEKGLRRAERILTISDAVRHELINKCGVAPGRVTTIYCGINPSFRAMGDDEVRQARDRLALPGRYFLCLGTIEPRKNLAMLLRAYVALPPALRERCPLLVAGPWGWKSDEVRDYYEATARRHGVRHLGYVPEGERPALLAGAVALLYPSFYEGFGLPPVEMLATGGAVLASTAAAMREVCGPHAEYLDPHDADGWHARMAELATRGDDRARYAAGRIAFAARYNWDTTARLTRQVYHQVARR